MELHAQFACAMPRELLKNGIGWQPRAVYAEAILYCRENLTDGLIHRGELAFWMPDMPMGQRRKWLDHMVQAGILLTHPQGWKFPEHVWCKWNPLKVEVEAKREAEAQRKAEYRAKKRSEPRVSESVPTGQYVTATPCPGQPEPEPEPEPEPTLHRCTDSSPQPTALRVVDNSARNNTRTDPHPITTTLANLTRRIGG